MSSFAIGGVAPVGHKYPPEAFIDADLLKLPKLWAAAGTPNAVFSLSPEDLVVLTKGKIIVIK
ncbi:MAG: hypothetical protein KKE11_02730 [Gammaproteobacteria bacterium]|nr:hypothetical protein [Gammaproteobacteria bacterium]